MAHDPGRKGDLRRDELEAMRELEEMRADVVAHAASLPHGERAKVLSMVEATLARIDAKLADLSPSDEPGDEVAPPDAS